MVTEPTWARLYARLIAGLSHPKIELHQGGVIRRFVARSYNWTQGSVYQVIGRT